jgi:hypothetical protein
VEVKGRAGRAAMGRERKRECNRERERERERERGVGW